MPNSDSSAQDSPESLSAKEKKLKRHEILMAMYKNELEGERYAISRFDYILVAISVVGLGYVAESLDNWLRVVSAVLFAATIIVNLLAHKVSQVAMRRSNEYYEFTIYENIGMEIEEPDKGSSMSKWVERLDYLALVTFAFAIILLLISLAR